jgi:hypothetical protein
METNAKEAEKKGIYISLFIQSFYSLSGLIFYLISFILFNFYYKCPSLIKKEIFTFIFLTSLKTIIEIIIPFSLANYLISYFIGIISFYLILVYLDKCLTSKKISIDSFIFELSNKVYLFLIFLVCSFPAVKIWKLSENYIITENIINIIVAILFFIYINSKFKLLLDYLNEKQVTNSKIPDIYLPYMKAYYYYNSFKCAKTIFFFSLILIICFFSLNISNIFLKKQNLCLLALIAEKISLFCLILGNLVLFYSLYKKLLGIGKNEEIDEEGRNISNFTVIDVDIQQDDKEELSNFSKRQKKDKKNKKTGNKDEDNYIKIEGEETKEDDKDAN